MLSREVGDTVFEVVIVAVGVRVEGGVPVGKGVIVTDRVAGLVGVIVIVGVILDVSDGVIEDDVVAEGLLVILELGELLLEGLELILALLESDGVGVKDGVLLEEPVTVFV